MSKKLNAHIALVHLDSVADSYQALHALKIDESIIRAVIMAQKVNRSIAEDIEKWAGIKPETAAIFKPAFPNAMRRHI